VTAVTASAEAASEQHADPADISVPQDVAAAAAAAAAAVVVSQEAAAGEAGSLAVARQASSGVSSSPDDADSLFDAAATAVAAADMAAAAVAAVLAGAVGATVSPEQPQSPAGLPHWLQLQHAAETPASLMPAAVISLLPALTQQHDAALDAVAQLVSQLCVKGATPSPLHPLPERVEAGSGAGGGEQQQQQATEQADAAAVGAALPPPHIASALALLPGQPVSDGSRGAVACNEDTWQQAEEEKEEQQLEEEPEEQQQQQVGQELSYSQATHLLAAAANAAAAAPAKAESEHMGPTVHLEAAATGQADEADEAAAAATPPPPQAAGAGGLAPVEGTVVAVLAGCSEGHLTAEARLAILSDVCHCFADAEYEELTQQAAGDAEAALEIVEQQQQQDSRKRAHADVALPEPPVKRRKLKQPPGASAAAAGEASAEPVLQRLGASRGYLCALAVLGLDVPSLVAQALKEQQQQPISHH
jgi:hypothetical protein